jgi:cyclopropane fatty-acyl-phospholipid synthase-like methyltransferase
MSLPSMRVALDTYIESGQGDMVEILEGKKNPPIFGPIEMGRYLKAQLGGAIFHDTNQDASYLPEAYNKGDDWFEATLGEPMVYTGAIYTGPNETMWSAQLNKLEFIAHALGVKPGDNALDIGAGWGRLSNHLASKGANVTGVLMASDQQAYGQRMSKKLGNKNVNIVLKNFFHLEEPPKSFNVISSVEMAEHVGIRNYHKFLTKVHELLADDGTFYIQVAGLPRGYGVGYNHYQDIVWGMFMDEHVFPGADASCPMGWVITKLEQAGFEVQNVHNLGYHYSKTLFHWLQTWEAKKETIVKVYGERSWRRWRVFLAWSVRTARRGGSTVQFITATKSGQEAARIAAQDRLAPGVYKLPPHTKRGPGGGPKAIY